MKSMKVMFQCCFLNDQRVNKQRYVLTHDDLQCLENKKYQAQLMTDVIMMLVLLWK